MVLPSFCDENRHLGFLVENLFYATVVHASPEISMAGLLNIIRPVILFIAKVVLVRQVLGRILAGRMT